MDNIPLWRDISVVLLALEAFVLALVPLVVLYLANRGLRRLRSAVRPAFPWIRVRVRQVESVTTHLGELVVAPIIAVYASAAGVRRTVLAMVGLSRGGIRR